MRNAAGCSGTTVVRCVGGVVGVVHGTAVAVPD